MERFIKTKKNFFKEDKNYIPLPQKENRAIKNVKTM